MKKTVLRKPFGIWVIYLKSDTQTIKPGKCPTWEFKDLRLNWGWDFSCQGSSDFFFFFPGTSTVQVPSQRCSTKMWNCGTVLNINKLFINWTKAIWKRKTSFHCCLLWKHRRLLCNKPKPLIILKILFDLNTSELSLRLSLWLFYTLLFV